MWRRGGVIERCVGEREGNRGMCGERERVIERCVGESEGTESLKRGRGEIESCVERDFNSSLSLPPSLFCHSPLIPSLSVSLSLSLFLYLSICSPVSITYLK